MFRLLFEYGPLLAWIVLLFTFVGGLRFKRGDYAFALGFVLFFASQKFLIYKYFGGDSFVPDLPERLVNFTGWTYSSCMLLFVGSSIWWVLSKIMHRWRKWRRWRRWKRDQSWASLQHRDNADERALRIDRTVLTTMAVGSMLLAGWGIWEGIRVPRVKEVEVVVRHLPHAFDGLRLVQVSDLHCSPAARRARTEGIVEVVNSLHADLVCITGDFVDGTVEKRRGDVSPLQKIKSTYGTFACTGNHEYYHDYSLWGTQFRALGIRMLDNSHEVLVRGGQRLVVGGVTDFAAETNDRRLMDGPNIGKAFEGAPFGAPRILLQHRPIGFEFNSTVHNVDLQLSGHTHGGAILGLDQLVKRVNDQRVRGLYELPNGSKLYVSSGTGQWAGFPLRLGVPAEITLLVLRAR